MTVGKKEDPPLSERSPPVMSLSVSRVHGSGLGHVGRSGLLARDPTCLCS